ncbi:MAG: hypothetical protein C0467_28835 [Planctomycetaceae bacterium]|nr:hypothetical protein [Planctomycetaceae bacterium]
MVRRAITVNELDLFAAAIAIADPTERASLLDRECAGNPELRARIDRLLAAHDRASSFLERPAAGVPDATSALGGEDRPVRHDDEVPLGFLEPATKPDSLGRLGHYEVLEVLGRGGFGIVLKAFDDSLHRVVAVKVLSPEMAATSPARKRFLREARASAPIRHENVVQVYAIEETPLPYIVMEFVPGRTLQTFLDGSGPLEVPDVVRIGVQIARGLAAAHELGLIHRDIKPANILLEGGVDRRVKITDFGLARAADDASITASGVVAGTPLYMAPEQARGDHLDHRADLFSLGSVLYTMCAGHPPFRANTTLAVLKRVCDENPRPIPEITPEVPRWLCDIIAKLHAKNPDERFQSAKEVADLLAKYAVEPPPVEPKAERKPVATVPRPSRSNLAIAMRVLFAAVGVLFLTAVAVIAVYFASQGQRPADPVRAEAPPEDQLQTGNRLPTRYKNTLGMEFALVPKGKGWLGGGGGKVGEKEVEFKDDFYLGISEVTQEEWEMAVGANPSYHSRKGGGRDLVKDVSDADLKRFPVEQVSWNDTQVFLEALNQRDKQAGWMYRLPTEDEWEYACRGGPATVRVDHAFDFYLENPTNQLLPAQANIRHDNWLGRTCKVGLYPPNRLGLHDMHGNVAEWCNDELTGEKGGVQRLYRGGAFWFPPHDSRAARRQTVGLLLAGRNSGLRVARVRVDSPAPVLTPVAPITAEQRNSLEWALSVGGRLACIVNGKPQSYVQGDRLPDLPFTVQVLNLGLTTAVTEASIENLKAFPRVGSIVFFGPPVGDAALAKAATYPGLASAPKLSLEGTLITDAGLAPLQRFERLEDLNLSKTRITAKGVAELRPLKLKLLVLRDCQQIKDDAADVLADMPTLSNLNLQGTTVTPAGIAELGRLPALRSLSVSGDAATDDLVAVVKLRGLTNLRIDSPSVTDAGLARLTALPELNDLVFTESKAVTDVGVEHIAKCKNLRSLNVKRCGITEAGVKKLAAARPDLKIEWDGGVIEPKATQSDVPAGDWVQLFNGKDLMGWSNAKDATGNWKVVDGAITCSGTNDNLYTKRDDFGDFHLRAEVKCNKQANGGIYFRTRKPLADGGDYEAQIAIDFKPGMGQLTGSLWHLVVVKETPVAPDTWFTYEIIAQGNRIRLLVNGKETADYTENRAGRRTKGHIALQHHHVGSEVHFRKIEVREWDGGVIEPKVVADPDRRAAELVLSVGGSVRLSTNPGKLVTAVNELPAGEWKVNMANVVGKSGATDAVVTAIADCQSLGAIYLSNTPVTDAGLTAFKDRKNLVVLELARTAVTDAGLAHFKDHRMIEQLTLSGTRVTDQGLATFGGCKKLIRLLLSETTIGDAGLAHFKDCKNLATLDLKGTRVTDAGLANVRGCNKLMFVHLNGLPIGDAGVANFKDCKDMQEFNLHDTGVSDVGLEHLAGLTSLRTARLKKTKVTEAGVKKLAAALPGCKIEWDGGVIEPK